MNHTEFSTHAQLRASLLWYLGALRDFRGFYEKNPSSDHISILDELTHLERLARVHLSILDGGAQ